MSCYHAAGDLSGSPAAPFLLVLPHLQPLSLHRVYPFSLFQRVRPGTERTRLMWRLAPPRVRPSALRAFTRLTDAKCRFLLKTDRPWRGRGVGDRRSRGDRNE